MSNDRNAIITGAASGLGRALAVRLARAGWRVAICDINDAGSCDTLALVRAAGGDGQVEHLDVTCPEEWQALRVRLQAAWPQLDLLVNNAGVSGAGKVGSYTLTDWHWIVDVNLWSGIYGCHTFVDWLKQNPRGAHIINAASIAAVDSAPSLGAYNVSKAGILALSETLYTELLPHRVGVTVLCPAFFATNLVTTSRFSSEQLRNLFRRLADDATMSADYVADQAVRAMLRKQFHVMLPAMSRFRWYLKRLAPMAFLRGISKAMHRRGLMDASPECAVVNRIT
jgi:NAD(P)-dependent dehydrogenase (short-subunit alcohol dehydrogenase family)